MRPWLFALVITLAGCGSDSNLRDNASCDGVLNAVEDTVDDAFDQDGDGFFDASNANCVDTYEAAQLDCDDLDADVNPGNAEVACNDLDDDCNEDTIDEPDADEDGFTPCEGDCDDGQPLVGPDEDEELCDGLDNDCDEATLDGADEDADGYTVCEDCLDTNPDVNPATAEEECDGLDNDCNAATPDGDDFDNDGMVHCFDCDDANPLLFPGNPEICEDGVDQDCDGLDADCPPPTWDGIWGTDQVTYSCASGQVDINFSSVSVIDTAPSLSFTFIGGSQPGTISGTLAAGDVFNASFTIPGLCDETYALQGSFTGPNNFTATFSATFTDNSSLGIGCIDCTTQSWTINGTR